MTEPRWFIGYDDVGHEYLVPVARQEEWDAWVFQLEKMDTDSIDYDLPPYAKAFSGYLTFTDPQIEPELTDE